MVFYKALILLKKKTVRIFKRLRWSYYNFHNKINLFQFKDKQIQDVFIENII